MLAKVLSLRLREVLVETIGLSSSFCEGRQISDLVLIAIESVEEYRAR